MSQNRRIHRNKEVDSWFLGARKSGEWGVIANGCEVSLGGDDSILELDGGDSCTSL